MACHLYISVVIWGMVCGIVLQFYPHHSLSKKWRLSKKLPISQCPVWSNGWPPPLTLQWQLAAKSSKAQQHCATSETYWNKTWKKNGRLEKPHVPKQSAMSGNQTTSITTVSYQSQRQHMFVSASNSDRFASKWKLKHCIFGLCSSQCPACPKPAKPAKPAKPVEPAKPIRSAKQSIAVLDGLESLDHEMWCLWCILLVLFPKAWKSAHFSVRQYLARETLELQSVQSLKFFEHMFRSFAITFNIFWLFNLSPLVLLLSFRASCVAFLS